jgi:hypothetical protein
MIRRQNYLGRWCCDSGDAESSEDKAGDAATAALILQACSSLTSASTRLFTSVLVMPYLHTKLLLKSDVSAICRGG